MYEDLAQIVAMVHRGLARTYFVSAGAVSAITLGILPGRRGLGLPTCQPHRLAAMMPLRGKPAPAPESDDSRCRGC